MNPLGRQGFKSLEEAKKDAESTLFGLPYLIAERDKNFGWMSPVDYAKRVVENNQLVSHGEFST